MKDIEFTSNDNQTVYQPQMHPYHSNTQVLNQSADNLNSFHIEIRENSYIWII